MYSSTLPSTSAVDTGGWATPRFGRFASGKTRYPLYRRLGGPLGRSGRVRKISPPHQVSIPGPSSPERVALPTELSRPPDKEVDCRKILRCTNKDQIVNYMQIFGQSHV